MKGCWQLLACSVLILGACGNTDNAAAGGGGDATSVNQEDGSVSGDGGQDNGGQDNGNAATDSGSQPSQDVDNTSDLTGSDPGVNPGDAAVSDGSGCGDGQCTAGETPANCPQDCGVIGADAGSDQGGTPDSGGVDGGGQGQDGGPISDSISSDAVLTDVGPFCGDGNCDFPGENDSNCAVDCNGKKDAGGLSDTPGADGGALDGGAAPQDGGGAEVGNMTPCTGKPDGSACSSGKLCTTNESCLGGQCQGGKSSCDDNNACTVDTCDSLGACGHTNTAAGTACTVGGSLCPGTCNFGFCSPAAGGCNMTGGCKDQALACGSELVVQPVNMTSAVVSWSCTGGQFLPGNETSFIVTAPCAGSFTVLIRVAGSGLFGVNTPVVQQTAHVMVVDEVGSGGNCGSSAASCADATSQQQACGASGIPAPVGCKTEFLVKFNATKAGPRRIVVDSLMANALTLVDAVGAGCACMTGNVTCGNGKCDPGETCGACQVDCGKCTKVVCGDNFCAGESGESCSNCPGDCGACPATCGNGKWDPGETCQNCMKDCGGLCAPGLCGNGVCDKVEDCLSCPKDCKVGCSAVCGDGMCVMGETCTTCALDCGLCAGSGCGPGGCSGAICGNGQCEAAGGETQQSCPADCKAAAVCGNGQCEYPAETPQSCPADCKMGGPAVCGDGMCQMEAGETKANCPADCAPKCGNGICETNLGESKATCPADCPG